MKKSDLKDGMIVQTGEDIYLVCGDKFLSLNGYMGFNDYDENLKIKDEGFEKYNINFVYKEAGSLGLGLKNLLNSTNLLEKIWERKKEIDWSKVPKWTKVQYERNGAWINCYHINYDEQSNYWPCECTVRDEFTFKTEKYIECVNEKNYRIHPSITIPEEWYKEC